MKQKKVPRKTIDAILKEFRALETGKTIKVPIKCKPIEVRIFWEEDSYCQSCWDDRLCFGNIQEALAKHQKQYNNRITRFCNKVMAIEDKYGLPRDQIWKDHIW